MTLMYILKILIQMAPYFPSKLKDLNISDNSLLLLDIQDIIQVCFTTVTQELREPEFLQVISIFSF